MAQDLETFLGMNIASDAFRVERTYGEDGAELTQLVYLVLADGSELGPYIRKQFEVASGVGSVYNVMWHAQREGMRSALLPRVICCKESNGVESVLFGIHSWRDAVRLRGSHGAFARMCMRDISPAVPRRGCS